MYSQALSEDPPMCSRKMYYSIYNYDLHRTELLFANKLFTAPFSFSESRSSGIHYSIPNFGVMFCSNEF